MTTYIDTYVAGPSLADVADFAARFANYIPPVPGRAEIPAHTDPAGATIPAVAAVGDPSLYYTCIRETMDITTLAVAPLAVVDSATGAAVVGVWA